MLKYDVSGVGLNLGTAEEFANKTVGRQRVWACGRAGVALCVVLSMCGAGCVTCGLALH